MKLCLSCSTVFRDEWTCPNCNHAPERIEGFLSFAPQLIADRAGNPTDFQTLAGVEAGNFWFRARNRLIAWAVRRYFPGAANLLEIGCGTGFVLSGLHETFPALSLSGSEASCTGLRFAARRTPAASLFQMDARHIPFSDEFDVIGAFDVLEHIVEDKRVLAEMYRATRSGGGIVITVPQHAFLWSNVDEIAGHKRRYSAAELIGKVVDAGFRPVRKTSFVSLLLPLMLASRLGGRNGNQTASSEFALSPFANGVLERILNIEYGLIRLGVSLPLGGSLLIVARKA